MWQIMCTSRSAWPLVYTTTAHLETCWWFSLCSMQHWTIIRKITINRTLKIRGNKIVKELSKFRYHMKSLEVVPSLFQNKSLCPSWSTLGLNLQPQVNKPTALTTKLLSQTLLSIKFFYSFKKFVIGCWWCNAVHIKPIKAFFCADGKCNGNVDTSAIYTSQILMHIHTVHRQEKSRAERAGRRPWQIRAWILFPLEPWSCFSTPRPPPVLTLPCSTWAARVCESNRKRTLHIKNIIPYHISCPSFKLRKNLQLFGANREDNLETKVTASQYEDITSIKLVMV